MRTIRLTLPSGLRHGGRCWAVGLVGVGWSTLTLPAEEAAPSKPPPAPPALLAAPPRPPASAPTPVPAPASLRSSRVTALLMARAPKFDPPKAAAQSETNPLLSPAGRLHHPAAEEPPILLAAVHVEGRPWERPVFRLIDQQHEAALKPAFTFKDGGKFFDLGPASVKLQYNTQHKGFDLLDFRF